MAWRSSLRPRLGVRQPRAEADFRVHVQNTDCRPSSRGKSGYEEAIPIEVLRPWLSAGIEKLDDLSGVGIDAGEVRAFVQITGDAGQGEVRGIVAAAEFNGHDVLDLKVGDR